MALDESARPEHTYIRRRGRLTKAQARGLDLGRERYSASAAAINASVAPVGVEIGFGMGQALLDWARERPDWQLFGIELYQPGIGSVCDHLSQEQLDNVRVIEEPAQSVLAAINDASVDEYRIFFPDPWPKKRHFKRRLVQEPFVAELARTLRPGGVVRLATDWTPYAEWMRECFAGQTDLQPRLDQVRKASAANAADVGRDTTKFESRGERLGHDIHDLIYAKSE